MDDVPTKASCQQSRRAEFGRRTEGGKSDILG